MKKKLEQLKALLIESDALWQKIHDLHDEVRNYEDEPDLVDGWIDGFHHDTFVEWAIEELNKQKNQEKKEAKIKKLEEQLFELKKQS